MRSEFDDGRLLVASDVVGARTFMVGSSGQLRSPVQYYLWSEGVNHSICHAYCRDPRSIYYGMDCGCGFYAYFKKQYATEYKFQNCILGLISGTGRAKVGDRGFHVEKAEIIALIDPYMVVKRKWWQSRWLRVPLAVLIMFTAPVLLAIFDSLWDLFMLLSFGFLALLITARTSPTWEVEIDELNPSEEDMQAVRKMYPNIPFYPTLEDALKDHPLTFVPEGVKVDG